MKNSIKQQITKACIGKFINGDDKLFPFPKQITFEGNKILYNGQAFAEFDESRRHLLINRRLGLDNRGRINALLSHTALLPSVTYKVIDEANTHIFYTDSKGRINKTVHQLTKRYTQQRDNREQTKALMCKNEDMAPYNLYAGTGKRPPFQIRDEGGHIIADSIGGIPEAINIFPQAYVVNHSSEWRGMEKSIKVALEQGEHVHIKTQFHYPLLSNRPKAYDYWVKINGISKKFSFVNKNKV